MDENCWTAKKIETLYHTPLLKLISEASAVLAKWHDREQVEVAHLISIKTGGCTEDCKYCAQSSRYNTFVTAKPLMELEEVVKRAKMAKQSGASRICLGGAWRSLPRGKAFDAVILMIKKITDLDLEVCCTMGMATPDQLKKLEEAGLYAYNHNLDASKEFYKTIITTRSYEERLHTLIDVSKTNITLCSGAIVGMGESELDRINWLHTLTTLPRPPDSIPINILGRVKGTPLADLPPLPIWEVIRTIATARILFSKSIIRLSAGREKLSYEEQALCFLAGVNSLFMGEKLLTIKNQTPKEDAHMFELFGIKPKESSYVTCT